MSVPPLLLLSTFLHLILFTFLPAVSPLPASPGDRIGARYVAASPHLSFWIYTPVSGAATLDFQLVSSSLWMKGSWSQKESSVASRILESGCGGEGGGKEAMLDVGSHVGYFALMAAAAGCRALAVEVNPYFAELLRMSARLNRFGGEVLEVVEVLVGRGGGEERVFSGKSASDQWIEEVTDGTIYPTVSLDAIAGGVGEEIAYVKIDVEGLEADVLSSGVGAVDRARYLMVEVTMYADFGESRDDTLMNGAKEAMELLTSRGKDLYRMRELKPGEMWQDGNAGLLVRIEEREGGWGEYVKEEEVRA